jgi:hypothetical protein
MYHFANSKSVVLSSDNHTNPEMLQKLLRPGAPRLLPNVNRYVVSSDRSCDKAQDRLMPRRKQTVAAWKPVYRDRARLGDSAQISCERSALEFG